MSRPTRKPWADRAPVEAVTHEAQPSGLLEAWEAMPAGERIDSEVGAIPLDEAVARLPVPGLVARAVLLGRGLVRDDGDGPMVQWGAVLTALRDGALASRDSMH